eukprot:63321_1
MEYIHFVLFIYRYVHHQLFKNIFQNDIDDDDILNLDDLFASPTIQNDIDDDDILNKQNDAINKLNIEFNQLQLQLHDMQLQEKDDIIERLEEEIKQSNLEKYKQKYEA